MAIQPIPDERAVSAIVGRQERANVPKTWLDKLPLGVVLPSLVLLFATAARA